MQASGKITIIFNSEVKKIELNQVLLTSKTQDNESVEEKVIPAEYVFVFAGGEAPYPLLKKIGVKFGGPQDQKKDQRRELVITGMRNHE